MTSQNTPLLPKVMQGPCMLMQLHKRPLPSRLVVLLRLKVGKVYFLTCHENDNMHDACVPQSARKALVVMLRLHERAVSTILRFPPLLGAALHSLLSICTS